MKWQTFFTASFWKTKKNELLKKISNHIQFHKSETKGWYYLAICGWLPFKFLNHGGHFCMSWSWFWRHAVIVPRMRGWRWD